MRTGPDTMQLTIHDVAFGGKGVGRAGGMVVFVPYTIPGEEVTVRLTRRKKNYAEAVPLNIDAPSPDREEAPCPYFGHCGGCAYQHIGYARQLEIKAQQVEQTLRRVGKLDPVPMEPIIPSPLPFGYRNRIRVHRQGGITGFYAAGAETLVDIEKCLLAAPEVNARLTELRAKPLPDGDYTLAGESSRRFFEQTNPEVARAMLEKVEAILLQGHVEGGGAEGRDRRLIDAYCGAGFFSRHLRRHFGEVVGIEENSFAIEHARAQAEPHERYIVGDVSTVLPGLMDGAGMERKRETTLLLDPPAAGVTPRVLDTILAAAPREVIYVSCNPGTLARDLNGLRSSYRLRSVTPLDMFPQTAEIEVIVHLQKNGL